MSKLTVPYLSYAHIGEEANQFLRAHHSTGAIPVPIEEIIEFQMGINIVPMPGLQDTLENDGFEVLGFTSSDLKDITVDEWVWRHRLARYRFTLAHEVGHIVMHKHLYEPLRFHTIEEWKGFVNSIPEKEHGWYEWQAYAFAGLILVPEKPLKTSVDKHMKGIIKLLEKDDIKPRDAWESIWDRICDSAARDFEVSSDVIQKRVRYDKLEDQYRL